MTTQTLARLIIATAFLALLALLLFSERTVPAAKAQKRPSKADTLAPTTPTNLVVTAITENTVSLRWNPSTDNSGTFSYRVKVSWLHLSHKEEQFVFQTQTTYTVPSLAARHCQYIQRHRHRLLQEQNDRQQRKRRNMAQRRYHTAKCSD